jgi:hypothetical protein
MPQFFVVGCQRSGTTLMRLILDSHSRVHCMDETRAYQALQRDPRPRLGPDEWVGYKVPRFTEQFHDPVWSDEGLEEPCPNAYRGQKIIFLLRHPADTIVSMLKLKVGTSNWFETWVRRILKDKFARNPFFASRFREDFDRIVAAQDQRIAWAALYWKYKTASLLSYQEAGMPVLPVCYEALVTAPSGVLARVCEFLPLQWESALLRHHLAFHAEVFATGLTVGDTDPKSPIHSKSCRQWQRYLTPQQYVEVNEISGDLVARLTKLVPELEMYWGALREGPSFRPSAVANHPNAGNARDPDTFQGQTMR